MNIFISFCYKDRKRIEQFIKLLQMLKSIKLFYSDISIKAGEEILSKIKESIKECDIFIVFYSKNAKKSRYVNQEIGAAKALEKTIIPILLDKTKPEAMIGNVKYIESRSTKPEEIQKIITDILQYKSKGKSKKNWFIPILIGLIIFLLLTFEE